MTTRRLVALTLLAPLIFAAGLIWLRSQSGPVPGARRIVRFDPGRKGFIELIGWLSDDTVLGYRLPWSGPQADAYNLFVLDTRTGGITPVPRLNALREKVPFPFEMSLSPDGRWLLMVHAEAHRTDGFALRTDGSGSVRWRHDSAAQEWYWSPDSQGGYLWDYERRRPFRWSLSAPGSPTPAARPDTPLPSYLIGATRQGLLFTSGSEGDPPYVLTTVDAPSGRRLQRGTPAPFPSYPSSTVSPTGDRVLWWNGQSPQRRGAFSRLFHEILDDDAHTLLNTIWITDTAGGDRRMVGKVPESTSPHTHARGWGWLPDGEGLWFVHADSLWRVDVR